jgi:hypothetical protein
MTPPRWVKSPDVVFRGLRVILCFGLGAERLEVVVRGHLRGAGCAGDAGAGEDVEALAGRSLKVSALAARAVAVACGRQSSLWLLHLNAARDHPLMVASPGLI